MKYHAVWLTYNGICAHTTQGEFERIAEESRLKNKFNELERIMEEQPISLQTGQPRSYIPFDPKTLTGTKILQEKEKKRDELVTKLEKVSFWFDPWAKTFPTTNLEYEQIEQENALLNEKIQKQQERARRILSVIEGNTATVEATARLCINQKTVD